MIAFNNINTKRKTVVSDAVGKMVAAPRTTPLTPTTVASAEAVVAAAEPLHLYVTLSDKKVNTSTTTVVAGFASSISSLRHMLRSDVASLGQPQHETFKHLKLLQERLFPSGTNFLRASMNVKWGSLLALRTAMQEPACSQAIDACGLRVCADHVFTQIEVYGRMLGPDAKAAGGGEEAAAEAWVEAYTRFAVQVMHDYPGNKALQRELLGPYDVQLEQQRAADRAAERARRARNEADTGAPATPPAQAPVKPPAERPAPPPAAIEATPAIA